jgi:glutaredoxin
MRCRAHGLAVGPDGRCVLCRETERPPADGASSAKSALTLFAAGAVSIVVAALVLRAALGVSSSAPTERTSVEGAGVDVRAPARAEPLIERSERPSDRVAARFDPTPAPAPSAAEPSPITVDAGAASATAGTPPAPPSNSAIQAALRQTRIVMFATAWCPVCTRARAFLDANGLTREEHDVDHDERARSELERLTGKGSIPVFLVDGELVRGFSEEGMTRVLVASVEKRLGVKGIRVRTAGAP